PQHGDADDVRDEDLRTKPAHRNRGLKCQDEAEEKPEEGRDRKRVDAGPFGRHPGISPPDDTRMTRSMQEGHREFSHKCHEHPELLPGPERGLPNAYYQ